MTACGSKGSVLGTQRWMRKMRGPALIGLVESILLLSFRFLVDELVVGMTLMESLAFQVDGPQLRRCRRPVVTAIQSNIIFSTYQC
jgi:hypothetical protein